MSGGEAEWIERHRSVWNAKPALREYYRREIFDRIFQHVGTGPTLEVGAGPGFLAEYRRCDVVSDLTASIGIDVCADVQRLPFASDTFGAAVGVDILHHIAKPALALQEIERTLKPGGRLVLVEPWTGSLSVAFFKLVHHEHCEVVPDPWMHAFGDGKNAMDGNTRLSRLVLHDRATELSRYVPALTVLHTEPFGSLSCLLTGGFQDWSAPAAVIRGLCAAEDWLPRSVLSAVGVRALFVLEKSVER